MPKIVHIRKRQLSFPWYYISWQRARTYVLKESKQEKSFLKMKSMKEHSVEKFSLQLVPGELSGIECRLQFESEENRVDSRVDRDSSRCVRQRQLQVCETETAPGVRVTGLGVVRSSDPVVNVNNGA